MSYITLECTLDFSESNFKAREVRFASYFMLHFALRWRIITIKGVDMKAQLRIYIFARSKNRKISILFFSNKFNPHMLIFSLLYFFFHYILKEIFENIQNADLKQWV